MFYGTIGLVLEQARFTSKLVWCQNFFAAFSLVVYYVDERHPDTQLRGLTYDPQKNTAIIPNVSFKLLLC